MSAKQGQLTEVESEGTFLFLRKESDTDNKFVTIYYMGGEYLPSIEMTIPCDVAFRKMPPQKRGSYDGHLRFKIPVELLSCDKYRCLDEAKAGDFGNLKYSYSPQAAGGNSGNMAMKWLQTSFHSFVKEGNALETKTNQAVAVGVK